MTEQRTIEPGTDPVGRMAVDPPAAREKGLALTHEGAEYTFCGKGCLLEFRDDPQHYLDPTHQPSM